MRLLQVVGILLLAFFLHTTYASDKLTLLLDWFPNASHAPLFVAKQQGFFKEENLDIELIGPANPADPPKLVAAGKADIAITYEPQFMEQIDQGLPLIRIATLIDKPLDCLVVLKDGPIKTISDLKGKRVGYSSGGINNLTLIMMLRSVDLILKDVELINVHYNLTQALLSRKIDAATGMMRTFELIQLKLAGHPGLAFYPEKYGIPSYNELIYVVRKDFLKDPRVPHFLNALKKGALYLRKHPESTWQQFAKEHPELNDELNHQAWVATLPYFAYNPTQFNAKEWLQFARFLQQNGLIKNVKPINEYAI